jgi:formate hydrogenlyase transcriptional activator
LTIPPQSDGLIGSSGALGTVLELIKQVAATGSSVLLLGETGTGKELVARAIHKRSKRSAKQMIKVNCAALPASLVESELFGHEKGSFTGATDRRIGKFEQSQNSTLFLDEIGDMPIEMQVKLLRAVQEKEIERIGSKSTLKTDVRIIAATNRNLEMEVIKGRFRSDLYYRLNVFPIEMPALRDRKEDIPILITYFLEQHSGNRGNNMVSVSPGVLKSLMDYDWPGNIRELEHVIERAMLMNSGSVINKIVLPGPKITDALYNEGKIKTIDEVERDHILFVLRKTNGKVRGNGGAAELLKIAPSTLQSKMKKLGIRKVAF